MALCHECGSEVAENDVFCPFCGISLKPIDIGGETDDTAFESTIAMTESNVPDVSKGAAEDDQLTVSDPSNVPTLESIPLETEIDDKLAVGTSEEQVSPIHTDNTPAGINLDEPIEETQEEQPHELNVPVPAVLTELENTAGHLFKGINDKKSVPDVADQEKSSAAEEISPAVDRSFESDASMDPVGDVITPESEGSLSTANEEAFVSDGLEDSDLASEPVDGVVGFGSEFEPEKQEPLAEIPVDKEPDDQGISIPVDVPVPPDQFSTPSMFDSVRIMDADQEALALATSEGTPEAVPQSLTGNSPVSSQTSSSMGTVDTDGRRSAKLKPLEEGTVLNNRYEIVRKIGGGGMGAVYLASDNNLGGVLRAVKEMVQSHIEEEQQDKAILDFKRESMILSTLDHPSIPTIYDYFFDEAESRFYLVMKYISGGDLSARLRSAPEGKLDELTVTEWGIQIADVLDYLHNQPSTIVYRDLKPSNIMIDGNSGRVMLIDFGIARSINQKEEKGVTAVGTMGYAPPELFSGNVEPRSDIYSLGSTMFHLLTGADPQSNPLLIFDFQKNPRPRQINPQLSDQIERFLMTSVEYSAASRFTSAAEVRHVLEDHLANLRKGSVTYGVKEIPASVSLANQNVFCGFCGQQIVATDLFCAFCGAKQPLAQQGVHAEIYTPTSVTAKLFVVGTSDLESPTFQLDKAENLIGRRDPMSNIFPEVDLSKYDPQTKISRRHAKIWRDGTNYVLEDLASSNGTLVLIGANDFKKLSPHQPYTLSNGEKIRLGDTTLHFLIG